MAQCTDEELVASVAEKLGNAYDGIRYMFHTNDPSGKDSVSKETLLNIMYNLVGYITDDQYQRFLENIGLDKNHPRISFDTFVSRFKESQKIRQKWIPPEKSHVLKDYQSKAHPEEHLRYSDVFQWGRLKSAPLAVQMLVDALKRGQIDIRAILPEKCYTADAVVLRSELREALDDIGVNLTDHEYNLLWDCFDKEKTGSIPMQHLYHILNLTDEGVALTELHRLVDSPTSKHDPNQESKCPKDYQCTSLEDGVVGEGLTSPHGSCEKGDERENLGNEDRKESPATEAAVRSKIRAVVQERDPQAKFNSIMDCLYHLMEGRCSNILKAFKLFDLNDDGRIMRVDFRRVLSEFGFPIAALQLQPFLDKIGMSAAPGHVRYKDMMKKLYSHTNNFTSKILDNKIQTMLSGGGRSPDSGDLEGTLMRRLVEYIHSEYISLAVLLLNLDMDNSGLVPEHDFCEGIERCLGYKLTEKHVQELKSKIPMENGKFRYIDFLKSLEGEIGAWNEMEHFGVRFPKQNYVSTPSSEVTRLGKVKAGMEQAPKPPEKKFGTFRTLEEVKEAVKEFFSKHLFDIYERFRIMDTKGVNRFSRWQFGAILKQLNFHLSDKELDKLWASMKLPSDNMSTLTNIVMEFAPGYTKFETNLPKKFESADEEAIPKDDIEANKETDEVPAVDDVQKAVYGSSPQPKLSYSVHLMQRMHPIVEKHLDYLESSFKKRDVHGFGTITVDQMAKLIDSLKSGLNKKERDTICASFDFKNNGRFNYVAFMKTFARPSAQESKFIYSVYTQQLEKPQKEPVTNITVSEACKRIRNHLIKNWQNLRRAFKFYDHSGCGFLTAKEFRQMVKDCGVLTSEDDFYLIMTELDRDMDGKLCLEEFTDKLLYVV